MDELSRRLSGSARDDGYWSEAQHQVQTLKLGPMQNLVYLIADHRSGRAAVVDPGWDAAAIVQALSAAERLTDILRHLRCSD
ncbi:hypothetical protein U5801_26900, partial [Lamprobacter modestohalophilus]|nr:hypothetical protein [Lamprobacter modestohalophilus]